MSIYLSKRAKYKYIKKKKEDSGNITYIYDEKHVLERNKKKAKRLIALSKSLKKLRAQLKKDISNKDDKIRLAAIAVALIDETFERVGNRYSAADLKHYGVTTWLVKHIKFSNSKATIKYVGKSGVKQNKVVKNKSLVSALKSLCKNKSASDNVFEIENFTLSDNNVNQYLRPFKITAKDIRGLHANVEVRKELQKFKKTDDEKQRKENFKEAVEKASETVGHKASTLKNQYLIPNFEENYILKGIIIGPKTAQTEFKLSKRASMAIIITLQQMLANPSSIASFPKSLSFLAEKGADLLGWVKNKLTDITSLAKELRYSLINLYLFMIKNKAKEWVKDYKKLFPLFINVNFSPDNPKLSSAISAMIDTVHWLKIHDMDELIKNIPKKNILINDIYEKESQLTLVLKR